MSIKTSDVLARVKSAQEQLNRSLDRLAAAPGGGSAEMFGKAQQLKAGFKEVARRLHEVAFASCAQYEFELTKLREEEARREAERDAAQTKATEAQEVVVAEHRRWQQSILNEQDPNARRALQSVQPEAFNEAQARAQAASHIVNTFTQQSSLDSVKREAAQKALVTARANAEDAPASDKVFQLEAELLKFLDHAAELETEARSAAKLDREVRDTFKANDAAFDKAEAHHNSLADNTFVAMGVVLFLAAIALWALFFFPPRGIATSGMKGDGERNGLQVIESIVMVGAGRVAVLVFIGWALKFLAQMHRAHSDQAIIYRDKKSALTVAEVLVNAAPFEQKRQLLEKLSNAYLRFEQSAFSRRHERERADESLDVQIKRLKRTVEAVKPAFDAIGSVAEKSK